jgi:hypothetical protein
MIRTKFNISPPKGTFQERVMFSLFEKDERKMEDIEHIIKYGTIDIDKKHTMGHWLNQAPSFDHGWKLDSSYSKEKTYKLFNKLIEGSNIYNKKEKLRDFEILIANLLLTSRFCILWGKEYRNLLYPIRISRSPNSYIKSRHIIASSYIIKFIDILEKANFIKQVKGFRSKKLSKDSRIWPTKELLKIYHPFNHKTDLHYESPELVILRDKNKRNVLYKDTDETKRIRKILDDANRINRRAVIEVKIAPDCYRPINTDLHAIFHNGSFKQGVVYIPVVMVINHFQVNMNVPIFLSTKNLL